MARTPSRYKIQPSDPTPPARLVVVNGKRPGNLTTHIRRVKPKPINPYEPPPPDLHGAA